MSFYNAVIEEYFTCEGYQGFLSGRIPSECIEEINEMKYDKEEGIISILPFFDVFTRYNTNSWGMKQFESYIEVLTNEQLIHAAEFQVKRHRNQFQTCITLLAKRTIHKVLLKELFSSNDVYNEYLKEVLLLSVGVNDETFEYCSELLLDVNMEDLIVWFNLCGRCNEKGWDHVFRYFARWNEDIIGLIKILCASVYLNPKCVKMFEIASKYIDLNIVARKLVKNVGRGVRKMLPYLFKVDYPFDYANLLVLSKGNIKVTKMIEEILNQV